MSFYAFLKSCLIHWYDSLSGTFIMTCDINAHAWTSMFEHVCYFWTWLIPSKKNFLLDIVVILFFLSNHNKKIVWLTIFLTKLRKLYTQLSFKSWFCKN